MPTIAAPPLPSPIRADTTWCWEPHKPHARCNVRITATRWNGEEWWIEAEALETAGGAKSGDRHWNELSRFIEAAVFIASRTREVRP